MIYELDWPLILNKGIEGVIIAIGAIAVKVFLNIQSRGIDDRLAMHTTRIDDKVNYLAGTMEQHQNDAMSRVEKRDRQMSELQCAVESNHRATQSCLIALKSELKGMVTRDTLDKHSDMWNRG